MAFNPCGRLLVPWFGCRGQVFVENWPHMLTKSCSILYRGNPFNLHMILTRIAKHCACWRALGCIFREKSQPFCIRKMLSKVFGRGEWESYTMTDLICLKGSETAWEKFESASKSQASPEDSRVIFVSLAGLAAFHLLLKTRFVTERATEN